MDKTHPSYPYEDDSWREIMRKGERMLRQNGIERDVKLTSEEWHALINCILSAHHMIGQREGIDLDEVAKACGNYDQ